MRYQHHQPDAYYTIEATLFRRKRISGWLGSLTQTKPKEIRSCVGAIVIVCRGNVRRVALVPFRPTVLPIVWNKDNAGYKI